LLLGRFGRRLLDPPLPGRRGPKELRRKDRRGHRLVGLFASRFNLNSLDRWRGWNRRPVTTTPDLERPQAILHKFDPPLHPLHPVFDGGYPVSCHFVLLDATVGRSVGVMEQSRRKVGLGEATGHMALGPIGVKVSQTSGLALVVASISQWANAGSHVPQTWLTLTPMALGPGHLLRKLSGLGIREWTRMRSVPGFHLARLAGRRAVE